MAEPNFVPGELADVGVSYVEERKGKALVRLPNGSKSSVRFGALRSMAPAGMHLSRDSRGEGERVRCLRCDWLQDCATRVEAEEMAIAHRSRCADITPEDTLEEDGQLGYRPVGWAGIEITSDPTDGVTVVANAHGLLSLARLFEQMASRAGPAAMHLTRTLQLSPTSEGLTVARKNDVDLPNGQAAPDHPRGGR